MPTYSTTLDRNRPVLHSLKFFIISDDSIFLRITTPKCLSSAACGYVFSFITHAKGSSSMAVLKTLYNQEKIMAAVCIGMIPQLQLRKAAVTAIQLQTQANPMNTSAMVDHADSFTYVSLLQACIRRNDLAESKLLHAHIIQRGYVPITHLHNTLLNVYVRCGSLADARRVFDQMPERDICSWTVMMAAYARHRISHEALALFYIMLRAGVQPNKFTFTSVLPACADSAAIEEGMKIHEEIIRSGLQWDVFVANALINMYAKCRSIEDARYLFDKMRERDVVSWTALIAGYAQNGQAEEAMELFKQMWLIGVKPNSKTYASVLPACADMEQGMEIHGELIRSGFQCHVFVESALVDMYAKCGSVESARHLFVKMHQRDTVSWTVMIAGFARNGQDEEALRLFREMQLVGVKANSKTFQCILLACANSATLEQGMEIHEEINRSGFQSEVSVGNALLDMYTRCGNTDKARQVFDKMNLRDTISWMVMIAGYSQNGCAGEALKLFQKMLWAGVKSITKTFVGVLPACTNLGALDHGMEIHEEIIRRGLQSDIFLESALIDMYINCGSIEKGRRLFDKMPLRDEVSWTVMIAGYAQNGWGQEALKLFQDMQLAGVKPSTKTFASVLSACGNLAALEQGVEIHEQIVRTGFRFDVIVVTALLDMYAKCGSLDNARHLFDMMHHRDVVSWTAMIAGYAMHGCISEAIRLFEEMKSCGIKPNHITLVCVLSACCHAGLVYEGHRYFNCMRDDYHITPAMEHYSCMVDLISRAGLLEEAKCFINKMPVKPDASVWMCLLGACIIHNNIDLGESVAEHLFELDVKDAAPYVLLSNMYAMAGRWGDIEKVRKIMKDRGVKKTPGCSWIEVNKQVHAFLMGER